jgi:peroxiredoxin Q/BCP
VASPAIGTVAPDFTLPATTGGSISLSGFRGKKNVVLAFFPKAFTGGCTKEAQGFQADIQKFEAGGNQVLMVSTDDLETLGRWAESLKAAFPMLSDADGKVAEAYGVMTPGRKMAARATFIIDRAGVIREVQQGGEAIDTTGALAACARVSAAQHGKQ